MVGQSANPAFVGIGTADITLFHMRGSHQLRPADGSTAAGNFTSFGVTDGNLHLGSFTQNGSALKTWCDGSVANSITGTRTSFNYAGTQWLARGDGGGGTTVYAGALAEIVVVGSALSDADRQRVEGYLAHKWGLAASLPGGHPYQAQAPVGDLVVHAASGDLALQGVVSGATGLTKTGAGTLTLSGANTYTGTTTVSAGTLGGTGSIAGALSVAGGTLAPGLAGACGTFTGGSTGNFSSGGTLAIQIGGYAAGTTHDRLALTGALTLGGTSALTLDLAGLGSTGTATGIVTCSGTPVAFGSVTISNNSNNYGSVP
jgi:autotransporter-associated beta strand protein